MLKLDECRKLVETFVSRRNEESRIYWKKLEQPNEHIELVLSDWTEESEHCFAFSCVSKKFLETNAYGDNVVGHGPLIIDRRDGAIIETGSGIPFKTLLENYEKRGDPYKHPGCLVLVVKEGTDVNRISAVRSIREHTKLGLKDAKSCIDILSEGGSAELEAKSVEAATQLVSELRTLEYEVNHL